MKSKGISIWEQYIEYIVLGIAFLVLCWFAWSTFTSPIEYKQGSRVVTTSNIDDELLKAANAINPQIRDGSPSPIEVKTYISLLDAFDDRSKESISPSNRVIFPDIDMTSEIALNQQVQSELRMYVSPVINAPEDIRTQQWFGTIMESEFARVEELADIGIGGPPHDMTWVQIAGRFDVDEVVAAFAEATETAESIPSQWFDDGADIFDVIVERQTLGAAGWTTPEIVSVLPGHLSYREQINDGDVDAMERESIIRLLRSGSQSEITKPDFYALKGVQPTNLKTPSEWGGESVIEESPTSELEKDLKRADRNIEQQEKRIKNLQERIEKEESRGRGGGGGGSPLGGGGRPSGGGSNDSLINRLKTQLQRAIQELATLQQEKSDIEVAIKEIQNATTTGEEVIMTGDVWVWAHDMNAVPGEVYRYRMSIGIANPFFGHKPSLYPEQKPLADSVILSSSTSDWTPQMEVQKPLQWFVLNATQSGESISSDVLDSGKVSAEIFEFKDGSWSSNVIGIQVGQRVAQPREDGFVSDWFVLDILEDVTGEVVLLQHVYSAELNLIKPFQQATSQQLAQLRQQVKNQPSENEEEESDSSPVMPPVGGGGGGIGGGGGAF